MPDNTINWGQGAVENTNDWGKGKTNSANNWGKVYETSPSGDTNIEGGLEVSPMYGAMISGTNGTWTPPNFNKYGPPVYYTDKTPEHFRADNGWFEEYMIGVHGLCDVYEPPVSYWCAQNVSGGGAFPFRTPSGVTINPEFLPNSPYQDASQITMFVWRPARWANWMFYIDEYDSKTNNFTFGKGGNQGARGNNNGGDFFIENVFEELDFPSEYFYNQTTGDLYFYYNGTTSPPNEIIIPNLQLLINMTSTQWDPIVNVKHSSLTFQSTRHTYMERHGVPSAGDWALDRFGAIFLQGTELTTFDHCIFQRLDGNGIMISGYNRNTTISHNDFSYLGGNAIASWGYTNETKTDPGRPGILLENAPQAGIDGTDGEHPAYNLILSNTAREIGLYEKQSSFYIQAKTAKSTIQGNVFFNGPRAGINFNDGFGGGDNINHNLVFSTCRESGDHGPLNTWDRQPFLTTYRTGEPSILMEFRHIHHNFFIDNYSLQEAVDNDDGSAYYYTHHNFLLYGVRGMKVAFGGHSNYHYNNIYGYIKKAIAVQAEVHSYSSKFYNNTVILWTVIF